MAYVGGSLAFTGRRRIAFFFLASLVFIVYQLDSTAAQSDCAGQFMCGNGTTPRCVNTSFVCDGYRDCADGLDESNTTASCNATKPTCPRRNQLKCADPDGRCYNQEYRCDGVSDCWTGIDERNCTYANCSSNTFQCGVGLCIDMSKTCDGRRDCRDGSDESPSMCDASACNLMTQLFCPGNPIGNRCVNMRAFCDKSISSSVLCLGQLQYTKSDCDADGCLNNNCQHGCVNLTVGHRCTCRPGYQLVNKTQCIDIDECATTPYVCAQRCTNTEGSYQCSCAANYSLIAKGQCTPSSSVAEPYLIFGNRYYVHKMKIDGSNYSRIPELHTFVHVIDIDDKTNTIYYADIGARSLNKMRVDGSGDTLIDKYYGSRVEGIAVDWIGRKLYWTSTDLRGVYVSEMNGSFTTAIVRDESSHCRGIAVHPAKGYLFWSDWNSYTAFLGRIGMDGSQQTKIVTTDIYWPNCLAVDYASDRLFWVDAQTVRLECSDLNGDNRLVLNVKMAHPYGLAVFENYVYWTDWNYKSIHRADKFTGNNSRTLRRNLLIPPFDIKVYSPLRQPPGKNPCGSNNGGCSHLCLISPGGANYSCACPQNMTLLGDKRTCNVRCSESQFTCNRGDFRCIPWFFRCNGVAECINGEDELNCPRRVCSNPTNFQCERLSYVSRNCHSQYYVCDNDYDCPDRSDENRTRCQSRVCQMWEFRCPRSGRCIPLSLQCDRLWHCPHGEDEYNPKCRQAAACTADKFRCNNGKCIDASWYCDFDNDCGDMSDEPSTCWEFREKNPCEAGYRRCPRNYRCIPNNTFCDGRNDCRDKSDEQPEYCNCKPGDFTCANHRCIPLRWKCDCSNDCGDGSDENRTMCARLYRRCLPEEFRCDKCKCMSLALKCNGNRDCRDGTDEMNCTCPANTFRCQHGAQCIDKSLRCDGKRDCLDLSDEENCTRSCASNEFRCNNSVCIRRNFLCDQHDDCGDGSDELTVNCPSCPTGQFQCPLVRRCIPQSQVCDGVRHCEYGADEMPPACNDTCKSSRSFHCINENGTCLNPTDVCNGKNDCKDGSDERGCGGICDHLNVTWCPQGCDSTNRRHKFDNYTCMCHKDLGFEDLGRNGRNCVPRTGGKGSLVYSAGRRLYGHNMTTDTSFIVANTSSLVTVLDVDSVRGHVYWVDGSRMRRAVLNDNDTLVTPPQDLCSVTSASGIAYDWITRSVYWTQTNGGIYVTNVKFVCVKRTLILNETSSFIPMSIVVNPYKRMLYFINAYNAMPTIMTLWTSGAVEQPRGSQPLRVLINSRLEQPSSLTIDFNMGGRLFWVDQHKNTIESCAPDGSDRTTMFRQNRAPSPRLLDVFAGIIYWSTRSGDRLMKTERLGRGNRSTELSGQTSIRAVRLAHRLRYGAGMTNPCETKAKCTLCLLDASGGYRCLCPDNVNVLGGTQFCNLPSDNPNFKDLLEPTVCSASEYAATGHCQRTTVKVVPTSPSTAAPPMTAVHPQAVVNSYSISPAAIAVPVVLLLLLIILLAVAGVWAYRKGHLSRVRQMFKFQNLQEDDTAALEHPTNGHSSYDRAVFDGSNVDFDNPMYSTQRGNDTIDTTPAVDLDSDRKYMPGVAEVSSQSPYTTVFNDPSSSDA